MKILKRGAAVAAMAAAAVALTAGSASAGISPDPYSTTSGTGTFTASSPLGDSTCTLSGISATGIGTATGGVFTVNGATVRCTGGVISSAIVLRGGTVTVSNGIATTNLGILVSTFAGNCLYTAVLTGTRTGAGSIRATGGAGRGTLLGSIGICSSNPAASLSVSLPSLTITP